MSRTTFSLLGAALLALGFTAALGPDSYAQKKVPKSAPAKPSASKPSDGTQKYKLAPPPAYYGIVGLGSALLDSTASEVGASGFPVPMAILQEFDTARYQIRVRFHGLGVLGIGEDTVYQPSYAYPDTVFGYRPIHHLFQLAFPETPYSLSVDVLRKSDGIIMTTDPLSFVMKVGKYRSAAFLQVHDPMAGMGNKLLRREFSPTLLPFTIEANPGWWTRESLDTNGIYSLLFKDPAAQVGAISISMRPVRADRLDSAIWEDFKDKARVAFGSEGVAVKSLGDFLVEDIPTRKLIKAGYEFISKRKDGSTDYASAYLTPRAILLLLAPLQEDYSSSDLEYLRAIARSFKLKTSRLGDE